MEIDNRYGKPKIMEGGVRIYVWFMERSKEGHYIWKLVMVVERFVS